MNDRIEIIDNFLTSEVCDSLIKYFNKNTDMHENHPVDNGDYLIDLEITDKKEFNYLFNLINNYVHSYKCEIDWIKIVKWKDNCFQKLHLDTANRKETVYSSIIYLNEDYIGGQTVFEEGTMIKPIKKRALFFNGMYYKHGVIPVKKGPRYTLATWYKKIEEKND